MDRISYDWDRVDAYLELLDGLDFTRCIGGHSVEVFWAERGFAIPELDADESYEKNR